MKNDFEEKMNNLIPMVVEQTGRGERAGSHGGTHLSIQFRCALRQNTH